MASKAQAKAIIDSAVTSIKSDIDNILPVGVDIRDGWISFAPTHWTFILNAGGNSGTANSWAATIASNLTTALRTNSTSTFRRTTDGEPEKAIVVTSALAVYRIVNF